MIDRLSPVKQHNKPWGSIFTFDQECARLYVPYGCAMRMHGDTATYFGIEFLDCDLIVEANGVRFGALETLLDSRAPFCVKITQDQGKKCYVGKIVNTRRSKVIYGLNDLGYNDIGFVSPSNVVLGSLILGRIINNDPHPDMQLRRTPILEYEQLCPKLFSHS